MHRGQRVLRLVEQADAVVEVIGDVEDAGVGVLLPAGHGGRAMVELVERAGRRFLGRAVAVVVGEGELALQARNSAGQPEQLGARVEGAEVLVGTAALELRVVVVDEGVAARVVHRQAPGEVLRQRAGHCDRAAPRMVAADLRLVGSLGAEGRVLGVDDDRPGDGVGALGGGLRAAEHLDAVDVPDRGRAEEHLVVVQVVAIEVDRRPRHCAAPEHVLPVVRALGVLAADDRRAHRVGVDHVGTAIDHLGDRGVAGLLAVDVAGAGERYRGRRVLQRAFTFLAGHDQRLEGGGFVLGGRVFPGQCRWRGEQGGQRDDADSPVERAVRAGVQGSSPNGNDSLFHSGYHATRTFLNGE